MNLRNRTFVTYDVLEQSGKMHVLVPIMIIYLLHPIIFMLIKVPLFGLYSILCCCTNKGDEQSNNEDYEDTILSFKYIETMNAEHNNFGNHPTGARERAYNRSLEAVTLRAQQAIAAEEKAKNPMAAIIAQSLAGKFNMEMEKGLF